MGPEGGLYTFMEETEAPQAMSVSPGSTSAQGGKEHRSPKTRVPIFLALSSALHLPKALFLHSLFCQSVKSPDRDK